MMPAKETIGTASYFRKNSVGCLLLGLFCLLTACREKQSTGTEKVIGGPHHLFETQDFATALEGMLSKTVAAPDSMHQALLTVYSQRNYKPVWVSGEGILERTKLLIQELDSLAADGLDPEIYGVGLLKDQVRQFKDVSGKEVLAFSLRLDTACTHAYLMATRHLLLGRILPHSTDSLWFHENDSIWAAPMLLSHPEQAYVSLDSFRSHFPGYEAMRKEFKRISLLKKDSAFLALRQAIGDSNNYTAYISLLLPQPVAADSPAGALRAFQLWRGLKTNGTADSVTQVMLRQDPDSLLSILSLNMERLRWLPQDIEQRAIVVNVPAAELFLLEQGRLTMHMNTVVGKKSRQTPSLNALMRYVIFNPSWGVPPTIFKNDVKNGLGRSGHSYLARKGLHAFTRSGREVPASQVTAANANKYMFRQPPGPRNALGLIKFDMPNKWDIYLHDTPHRGDFKRRERALSSGCVRLERPRDLASYILSNLEGKNFDLPKIDTITRTHKTRYQKLDQPIMVHILYLTAFPDSNLQQIRFLPDVYGRDARLKTAISAE